MSDVPSRARLAVTVSDRAYKLLLRAYPKSHRQAFGSRMVWAYHQLRDELVEQGGSITLIQLWRQVLIPELRSDVIEQRKQQGAEALRWLSTVHGLTAMGGVAAVLAGMLLIAGGILPYLKTSLLGAMILPWELWFDLPWDVPVFSNPMYGALLKAAGSVGIALLIGRSRLTDVGLLILGISAILAVALNTYDQLFGPIYRYETGQFSGQAEVDALAAPFITIKNWCSLVGGIALAVAALRSPALGALRYLPFFLVVAQNAVTGSFPVAMAVYLLNNSTFDRLTLLGTVPMLVYSTDVMVGIGWATLGWMLWRWRRGGQRTTARGAEATNVRSRSTKQHGRGGESSAQADLR